ncbi:MAG: LytR C-terminal domain-containing protein [Bifidobacteriaceae bacterium]|nr:LytR C-terminal domain-containing protein [Bifidobacteriaceae bacterium]
MALQEQERILRKEYMAERQKLVFTIIGATLAVAVIISTLFYFNIFGLGVVKVAETQPNYGVTAPCAPKENNENAHYVDNGNVTLRVLNGTSSSGFAGAVATALETRNFNVASVGNYSTSNVKRTEIVFGKNAIPEAYTVLSNFNDAILRIDDRGDKLIDVVLGATFNNLVGTSKVPTSNKTITNIKGCVVSDKITNLPKAPEHDAVN